MTNNSYSFTNRLFVELLDKHGKTLHRYLLTQFPATLGRGYGNDVIIDDPYVSPQHARIDQDQAGNLEIIDLNSENGLYQYGVSHKISRLPLADDNVIQIGSSLIRVRSAHHVVAPTLISLQSGFLRSKAVFIMVLLMTIGIFTGYEYFSAFQERFKPIKLLADVLGMLIAVAIWSGTWALANRIVTHHTHFMSHIRIACIGACALLITIASSTYIAFAFSIDLFHPLIGYGGLVLVLSLVLYTHLKLATQQKGRRLAFTAIGLSTFVGIFLTVIHLARSFDFSNNPEYAGYLKNPRVILVSGKSLDEFTARADKLKNKVDALVKED